MFLGVDIGGTNIKIVILRDDGRAAARHSISSDAAKGPEDAFVRIAEAMPELAKGKVSLRAAGVACAGLVEPDKGKLHSSPNLPAWVNAPLSRIARKRLGVHTIVENDANAAAYGEYFMGSGTGRGTLVCLTLGTGVGGAIVTDGRLLRGSRNFAGEVGHMTICETGPRCSCGNRGCLEAYVGTNGLLSDARRRLARRESRYLSRWLREGRKLTPKLIADAASSGDRAAREVFAEAAAHLGTGIANLINIFNPDFVVIGGGVAKSFPLMRPHVEKEIRRRAFEESRRAARIKQARLGTWSAAVGAALLAKDSGA